MKLHLGCGAKYIPGWMHIDVVDMPHINLIHSIDRLPMILDHTVDVIYACHVLEHFLRREVPKVLQEWHRILKPNGLLRIAIPDFKAVCKYYIEHQDMQDVIGLIFGRQDGLYGFHHSVWDFESIEAVLTSSGYINMRYYDWRQTEHAWLDDYSQAYLPHMDKENGMLMSLNIEANAVTPTESDTM